MKDDTAVPTFADEEFDDAHPYLFDDIGLAMRVQALREVDDE